jgi:hypothetical protein
MKWSWVRRWRSAWFSPTPKSRRPRREGAVRPCVEELETRLAPSVDVSFGALNNLVVQDSGPPHAPDTVAIRQVAGSQQLQLVLNNGMPGPEQFTTSSPGVILSGAGNTTATIDTSLASNHIDILNVNLTTPGDRVIFGSLTTVPPLNFLNLVSIDVQQASEIDVNGKLQLGGSGGVTLNANNPTLSSGGIIIDPGAGITTDGGNITLTGQSSINGSNVYGVELRGANLATNTGNITLTGASGGLGANNSGDIGVHILDGVDASSIHHNSTITSTTGNISITGTGGGGGAIGGFNYGVDLLRGSLIQLTGASTMASISIHGTGGFGASSDDGVLIDQSTVTAAFGAIEIDGLGGNGAGGGLLGVSMQNGAQVTSTGVGAGAATITLNGTGGSGGDNDNGVELTGTKTLVTSVDGDIQINGSGGSGDSRARGVFIYNDAQVQSTGSAQVTINGTGGIGTFYDYGVEIGDGTSGGQVTSTDGTIAITGTGGGSTILGSAGDNFGILVQSGSVISSTTGTAAIVLTGLGGVGTFVAGLNEVGDNIGIEITDPDTLISSTISGDIEIFGSGGGTGDSNFGILIQNDSIISSTGTGRIAISGAGSYYGTNNNVGVIVAGSDQPTTITSVSGDIFINGSGGGPYGGSGFNNQGVLLKLGAQITSTGTVPGSSANIEINGHGGDGAHDNQGVRMIGNPGGPTTEVVSAEGAVTIFGTSGNGTAGMNHNNGVQLEAGAVVQSTDLATLTILGACAQDGDSANVGVELTDLETLVTATFGDIDIEGIGPDFGTGDDNLGVLIKDGAQVSSTGMGAKVGDIFIAGTGGVGNNNGYGIELLGSAAGTPAVTTVDGDITLFGSGDGLGNNNIGVYLSQGIVQSTGIGSFGAIILNGASCGCGADGNSGVVLVNTSSVTSVDAFIHVEGFGAGSGANNDGVDVSQSTIDATGTGDVTVAGAATTFSGTGRGVLIQQSSSIGDAGSGVVDIQGEGAGEVDIQWDNLTIQKTGGSYTFDGSTLSTVGLTLKSGPYTADINACACFGITFQGFLEVDSGVPLTFTTADLAQLGTVTTVLGQIVAPNGVQVNPGLLQGAGDVNAPILVMPGGTVAPGLTASTGILTGGGATIFLPGSTFAVRLDGLTPGSGYDQLDLTDPTITGANLDLSVALASSGGSFTILHSLTPIVGAFAGLPEGAVFARNGQLFQITYQGGAGDDIVLTRLLPVVNPPSQDVSNQFLNPLLVQILFGRSEISTNLAAVILETEPATGSPSGVLQPGTSSGANFNRIGYGDITGQGLIAGVVQDGGEDVDLAGQPVVLEELTGATWAPVRQTTLDDRGTFAFPDLPAGTYRVQLQLSVGRVVPIQGDGIIRLSPTGQAYLPLKLVGPQSRGAQGAPPDQAAAREAPLSPDECWRDAAALSSGAFLGDDPAGTIRDQVFAWQPVAAAEETTPQRDRAFAQPEEAWSQAAQTLLAASLATLGQYHTRHNSFLEIRHRSPAGCWPRSNW